jgi:RNA recognition motif-containing protein
MSNRLYVGNLAYKTRDEGLRAFFETVGQVVAAEVIMEGRRSNRSKGFGFVEFESEADAQNAMNMLNGQLLDDRPIRIDYANPKPIREERPERPMRDDRGDRGNDRGYSRDDRSDRGGRYDRNDRGDRGSERRDRFSRSYDRNSRF